MSKHQRNDREGALRRYPLQELADSDGNLPGKAARIAHFLDWWAKAMPYDYAAYNEVTKAVEGYKHLPRLDSKDVEQTRSTMARARVILRKHYNRDLHPSRGIGVRATVDDFDMVKNVATNRAIRVERSIRNLAETDAMIDTSKIPDNAATAPLKTWYKRSVKGILKQLASPDFASKLLPPAPGEEEKKT